MPVFCSETVSAGVGRPIAEEPKVSSVTEVAAERVSPTPEGAVAAGMKTTSIVADSPTPRDSGAAEGATRNSAVAAPCRIRDRPRRLAVAWRTVFP